MRITVLWTFLRFRKPVDRLFEALWRLLHHPVSGDDPFRAVGGKAWMRFADRHPGQAQRLSGIQRVKLDPRGKPEDYDRIKVVHIAA